MGIFKYIAYITVFAHLSSVSYSMEESKEGEGRAVPRAPSVLVQEGFHEGYVEASLPKRGGRFYQSILKKHKGAIPKELTVLSLSGGGVRGIATLQVVAKLQELSKVEGGCSLLDKVDVMAGISIGSVISAFVSLPGGYVAERMSRVLEEMPPMKTPWFKLIMSLFGIRKPIYDTNFLQPLFDEHFAGARMSDLAIGTLLYGIDLPTGKNVVFSNDQDLLLRNVLSGTTALERAIAPTSIRLPGETSPRSVADSGLYMSDPTFMTVGILSELFPGVRLNVLSLGAGENSIKSGAGRKWGTWDLFNLYYTSYATPAINRTIRGPLGAILASKGDSYTHLDIDMTDGVIGAFDNSPATVARIKRKGEKLVAENEDRLRDFLRLDAIEYAGPRAALVPSSLLH